MKPLAWAIFALATLSGLAGAGVALGRAETANSLVTIVDLSAWVSMPLAFGGVGALIVSRLPRQPIGWLLLCPAALSGGIVPLTLYLQALAAAPAPPPASLPLLLLLWFSNWGWLLLIQPIGLIALLFPTGRPPGSRWGWLLPATAALAAAFIIVVTLQRQIAWPDDPRLALANPLGLLDQAAAEQGVVVWIGCQALIMALSGAALLARFRRADPVEKAQIRWLLSASGLFLTIYILSQVSGAGGSEGLAGDLSATALNLTLPLIPIAIGIAILRHRLFDIDLIIRRTLIYSTLTALLALTYFGLVLVLQGAVGALGGARSEWITVASTLAVAALVAPLRARVQAFIDRRFFRRKYDAARTLAGFAAVARDETDLGVLTGKLAGVVQGTMEPETVGVWLRPSSPGLPLNDQEDLSAWRT